ncbi:MAG: tetratricopeptide repeat protein [Acidobacteriaceae bacterium]|nr:tetratricopeptide repeat protein [Acidobacteriaceae bacterium]
MVVAFPILLFWLAGACEENLKPATLALQQSDPAKALALLDPLRSDCAQSSAFYELLGLASELSGKAPAAEKALRTAVSLNSKSSRLLTELGATYLRNGKAAEAMKVLDQALALDPSDIAAVKYAIGAAVQLENWRRAADLFRQIGAETNPAALQQEPVLVLWFAQTMIGTNQSNRIDFLLSPQQKLMSPSLLFSLGTLFAQHQMYQRAIEYLRKVPPESADDALYFNLGLCYSHLQKLDEARRCYFEAVDKHPEHVDAYLHVGLDYAASGDTRMAIPWLFRAHALGATRADISYALAEQLIRLEYFNTAKELLVQAKGSNSREALLVVADGDLKRAQNDTAGAMDSYQKALAEQPGLTPALVGVARLNISQGKDGEARKFLSAALARNPADPIANGELGLLDAHEGNWESALLHLQQAWAEDRSNPEIAFELARTYRHKDRPLESLQLLTSLNPAMRESSTFHFELAQLYAQLHRTEDAKAERDAFSRAQTTAHDALHFENPHTYVH